MKKIYSALFSFILIISIAIPTHAQTFQDVPKSSYSYSDVEFLVDRGILDKATNLGATKPATRQDVVVMLAKALNLENTTTSTTFKDIAVNHRYSGYINNAAKAGVVNGMPDGTFQPDRSVTRGQMAAFIERAFKLKEGSTAFQDVPQSHYANKSVKALVAAGITTGYPDGTFRPNETLNQQQLAAFIGRAIRYAETGTINFKETKVHFIDVGQGDSIFIQSADGKTMLVDGGLRSAGDDVVKYLKSIGVSKIDYIVATHPDADHIGGLIEVINNFNVGTFVNSGKHHTSQTYEDLLNLVNSKNITYKEPDIGEYLIGNSNSSFSVQSLYSDADAKNTNDASIVLLADFIDVEFLLMADASIDLENLLADSYNLSHIEVLKAGHHGSDTSSSLEFLKQVKPETVILSYGEDNSYGHPHKEVMENLYTVGAKAYSTAESGNIVVTTNGYIYNISAKEFENTTTPTPKPNPNPSEKPQPPVGEPGSGTYVIPGAPTSFKNCTAMRVYYPNGVKSIHPAYDKKHDRDKDGWACER